MPRSTPLGSVGAGIECEHGFDHCPKCDALNRADAIANGDGKFYVMDEWGDIVAVPARQAGSPRRRVQAVLRLRWNPCIAELVRYVSGFGGKGVDLDTLSRRFFDGFDFCPMGLDAHQMADRAVYAGALTLDGRVLHVPPGCTHASQARDPDDHLQCTLCGLTYRGKGWE